MSIASKNQEASINNDHALPIPRAGPIAYNNFTVFCIKIIMQVGMSIGRQWIQLVGPKIRDVFPILSKP